MYLNKDIDNHNTKVDSISLTTMSLKTEIETKLQIALKERKKLEISTLRLILAAIKDREIANKTDGNKKGVKDEDIRQLLKNDQTKKRIYSLL